MKEDKQKRKSRYTVNFTKNERNELEAQARRSGLPLQDFTRLLLTRDIPDNVYDLKSEIRDLEAETESLQANFKTTKSELEEMREFKREGARKERVIADLEEELSIARSEAKRRRKEPEPEPEPPSRWARVLGSEPTPVERFVLEYNELMKEKRRQRDKKREEELEKWREELRRKEEERQERRRLEREERESRRRIWRWMG